MMNFVQEEKAYFCNNNEEEDDEEVVMIRDTTARTSFFNPFSSSTSSATSSMYKAAHIAPQNPNLWPGSFDSQESPINFDKKLELMDLSLGSSSNEDQSNEESIEKEHMFDKVVTPSDVGKLNRLVIPKQHAEKYFPLDSSSNEKGLLLNFEDRNGKSWRFRYSYWNSSQSYVMTKGWSRFVKEKKLDAGDIVSFQRGVGESGKGRLYIDWRRRPDAPDPTSLAHIQLQNQFNFPRGRLYSLYSLPQSMASPRNYEPLHRLNYSIYPYHHHQTLHQHHQQQQGIGYGHVAQYYLREGGGAGGLPMVIDSVPVAQGNQTAAKRLRLFGVNMECPTEEDESSSSSAASMTHGIGTVGSLLPAHRLSSSSSVPYVQSRLPNSTTAAAAAAPLSRMQAEYQNKGKSSCSLSFDLDL